MTVARTLLVGIAGAALAAATGIGIASAHTTQTPQVGHQPPAVTAPGSLPGAVTYSSTDPGNLAPAGAPSNSSGQVLVTVTAP